MTDIVSYQPPFGFIGAIANKLVIRSKINEIFVYRTKALENKFGIFK
jgi:ligand-binding SRPBCC domain-containing protein